MQKIIFEADSRSSGQKFLISYGIQKFIAVLTGAQTWNLSSASKLIYNCVIFIKDPY